MHVFQAVSCNDGENTVQSWEEKIQYRAGRRKYSTELGGENTVQSWDEKIQYRAGRRKCNTGRVEKMQYRAEWKKCNTQRAATEAKILYRDRWCKSSAQLDGGDQVQS